MQSKIFEIARDTYRISTFHPDFGIQFNQFLIADQEPFLMHTGLRQMFTVTLEGVKSIIDPATLRWIGFSHFESDECGALNEWLEIAPRAQPVCSLVGAMVNVNDFAVRMARPLADQEILQIGAHDLRFLATPHVPHCWDAGLFFDETEQTLFCSDLFFQPGDPGALTESDIVEPARVAIVAGLNGPLANDLPYTPYTDGTLKRLAALKAKTLAVMHGASYLGDTRSALVELAAVLKTVLAKTET